MPHPLMRTFVGTCHSASADHPYPKPDALMKFKQILWLYGERIAMRPYNFAHIAASFSPLPACVGEGAGGEGWMRALPCYLLNLH